MKLVQKIGITIAMLVIAFFVFPMNTYADADDVVVNISRGASSSEINAALSTEHEGRNLVINFASGSYYMTSTLYVYSNTTINATGAVFYKQDTINDGTTSYGAMLEAYLDDTISGYNGSHDITINGGTWDSKPVVELRNGTETFRFIHCKNISISNAVLRNVPVGSHLLVLAGTQNAKITGCTFYGYKNWSTTTTHKEALQLDVTHSITEVPTNQVTENATNVWDDTPCDNVEVSGCSFYKFSRGIGSHTAVAGTFHTNVKIKNNYFYYLSDAALKLFNYKDATISNNKIGYDASGTAGSVKLGILVYTWLDDKDFNDYYFPANGSVTLPTNYNITISNNTIKNVSDSSGTWGDAIRVIGAKDRPLTGVTISGNKISSTSRYGIYATYANGITINGTNTITSTKKDAILIGGCKNSVVSGNTITSPSGCGIKFSLGLDDATGSNGSTATGNTIKTAKGTKDDAGIYVYKSTKCTINNNTITSPKGDGVKVTTGCTGTVLTGNTITSPTVNGITAYSSKNVTISNNKITTPTKDGINVNTSSTLAMISGNKISKPGNAGVWMSLKSSGTIKNNTITSYSYKTATNGILVYQSSGTSKNRVVISENTITGRAKYTGRHAIFVSGSNYVTTSGNKITNADGEAISYFKSTYGIVTKNTIKNPKGGGMNITTNCTKTSITSNTIVGAKNNGITVYSSKSCTVSKNKISSKKDAINVNTNSNSVSITSNTINVAGGSGIWYTSSKAGTIKGNTIKIYGKYQSTAYGIMVYKCGGTKVSNSTKIVSNTITGPGKGSKKTGIFVSSTPYATISSNKITKPGAEGILAYQCKGVVITKNTIKTTASHTGIWLSQSEKGKITNNTIKGSKKTIAISITGTNKYTNKGNKIK